MIRVTIGNASKGTILNGVREYNPTRWIQIKSILSLLEVGFGTVRQTAMRALWRI
jgi:hypothetical protein